MAFTVTCLWLIIVQPNCSIAPGWDGKKRKEKTKQNKRGKRCSQAIESQASDVSWTEFTFNFCDISGLCFAFLENCIIYMHGAVGNAFCSSKGQFTQYNFVACDMLTTSLGHELFRVNQTYNSLAIAV